MKNISTYLKSAAAAAAVAAIALLGGCKNYDQEIRRQSAGLPTTSGWGSVSC